MNRIEVYVSHVPAIGVAARYQAFVAPQQSDRIVNPSELKGMILADVYPTTAGDMVLTFKEVQEVSPKFVGGVDITEDSVTISDASGEIAHWIEDEWIEDPSVATAMANAIHIYYTSGPNVLRRLIEKDVKA